MLEGVGGQVLKAAFPEEVGTVPGQAHSIEAGHGGMPPYRHESTPPSDSSL